ncbi:hypothetical protein Sp245p_27135 (plasmid) [Azospirillum baldaniorum]|uniref:Uncharacterized protein n=1 Tax=Azospirillum baldaniorum TaxID=1064539 RepID=A0A9P1JX90_9PROT|nr:hypothetical protein Sp245p_27135 [Azospirillum baldaniorum]CCD01579.1 protein of unknown function [Azospirillum baldaniorum]
MPCRSSVHSALVAGSFGTPAGRCLRHNDLDVWSLGAAIVSLSVETFGMTRRLAPRNEEDRSRFISDYRAQVRQRSSRRSD